MYRSTNREGTQILWRKKSFYNDASNHIQFIYSSTAEFQQFHYLDSSNKIRIDFSNFKTKQQTEEVSKQ